MATPMWGHRITCPGWKTASGATYASRATTFGDTPLNCELKLEVWDSPNSAGVVIDAVRCVKLAMDRGIGGALTGPSSYFMKSPPEAVQRHRGQAPDGGVRGRRRGAVAHAPAFGAA